MKKAVTFISIICILLSLSGCNKERLKEIRSRHAVYEDESKSAIVFRDNKYLLYEGEIAFNINTAYCPAYGYATDPDVPALLAEKKGDQFDYDWDKNILIVDSKKPDEKSKFFIREDMYDSFSALIEGGKLTDYCLQRGYKCTYLFLDTDKEFVSVMQQTLKKEPVKVAEVDVMRCDAVVICDSTKTFYSEFLEIYKSIGSANDTSLSTYYLFKDGKYFEVDKAYSELFKNTTELKIDESIEPELEYGPHYM